MNLREGRTKTINIQKNITLINRTVRTNRNIQFIVIHYVGAVSTAYANTKYFKSVNRGASAHYFVDETSVWQCVEDKDDSWHAGTKGSYTHPTCRNSNSIGIELCIKRNQNGWYFEPDTIKNGQWLTRVLAQKYNIATNRILRHFDVTGKICPEPFVRNTEAWIRFRNLEGVERPVTQEEFNDKMNVWITQRGLLPVSSWANVNGVWTKVLNQGVMSGNPQSYLTRQEFAVIMDNLKLI